MNRKKEILKNPLRLFLSLGYRGFFKWMPDEMYLKTAYFCLLHKKLDLNHPKTFNEKLQWLKIHDRKPEYTKMADKHEAKLYAEKLIGPQYIIPALGVWDSFDEIDFSALPDEFVLKCTHDSGSIVICRDKKTLNIKKARKKLEKGLRHNPYWSSREWPYKNIKPRIIAEKYLEEKGHLVPEDYKVYCLNGEPAYIVVFHNRFDASKPLSETVYDLEWQPQHISFDNHFAVSDTVIPKPACIDEMIAVCRKLCKNMAQVRIDFYIIENRIYFGEITFYTTGGFQPMIPEDLDRILGEKIKLPAGNPPVKRQKVCRK